MRLGYFKAVNNKKRKFGSMPRYVIGIVSVKGVDTRLAFTEREFEMASMRATKNPEDFIEKSPREVS